METKSKEMFLDEIEILIQYYEKGAKKVSFIRSYPKITKDPIDLKIVESSIKYDLFFNKKGYLSQSVHFEHIYKYKIIYIYDFRYRVISALKLQYEDNRLLELNNYTYDKKGRIKDEICNDSHGELIRSAFHTYSENMSKTVLPGNEENENEAIFHKYFDDDDRIIEEKAIVNNTDLIHWFKNEYNKSGDLIREISLDENGHNDGVIEFYNNSNGLEIGYKSNSKEKVYHRENAYTFNDKGHWTNKTFLNDGEPIFSYDRVIEYH